MYIQGNKPQAEMTASPEKYPQKYFKEKKCRECSSLFQPKAPSHLYCSQSCSDLGFLSAYLRRNYSITAETYFQMKEQQNHRCAICGGTGFKMKQDHNLLLVVDHDHVSGKVRGLLCHNCNRGLGLFKDSVDSLEKAKSYLEGATTIPNGSTLKRVEAPSIQNG